jgi:hypothetical protein
VSPIATAAIPSKPRGELARDKAGVMLADIYNWFTEGFDTAGLREAKALLEELSC